MNNFSTEDDPKENIDIAFMYADNLVKQTADGRFIPF